MTKPTPSDDELFAYVKSLFDLTVVVRNTEKLTQSGTDWFGVCPFCHSRKAKQKNVSFCVFGAEQRWTCFQCNRGGDIFTWYQVMDALTQAQTVKFLTLKAMNDGLLAH